MRITDVETILLRLPEVRPVADGTQDCLIIKVHTDEGLIGIGEVHTSPYVAQTIINAPMSHVSSRGLRNVLVGEDAFNIGGLWDKMYRMSAVYGRRGVAVHAISGIDLALWDLLGKATGQPIFRLLGGQFRDRVPAYASVLMPPDTAGVEALTAHCLEQGFKGVKFGWGSLGQSAAEDAALVAAARRIAGRADIMVDIGFGTDLHTAIDFARRVEEHELFFLEEPLSPDNLDGFRRLGEATRTRIATGEKETTRHGFRQLLEIGKLDVVQPDLARAGGFTECRVIGDLADLHGSLCIPHVWSTDILVAASLQFIASRRQSPYLEFCLEENPIRRTVVKDPIRLVDGMVPVPTGPGLGIELNEETLNQYAVSRTRHGEPI